MSDIEKRVAAALEECGYWQHDYQNRAHAERILAALAADGLVVVEQGEAPGEWVAAHAKLSNANLAMRPVVDAAVAWRHSERDAEANSDLIVAVDEWEQDDD